MATVLIGAAIGAAATTAGFTAITTGALLTGALLGGGSALLAGQAGEVSQPTPVGQVSDKTLPQEAEQLDALQIGEESEKRKRKGAKGKFKIQKDTIGERTGVSFGTSKKAADKATTGVQL